MSSTNHPNHDFVPDAAASYVSDSTTIYSGVSNLTDNSNSRNSRTSSHFTNRSDSSSLRRDREREGRCADCGAETHEIRYDSETGTNRKVPLNIEGEVHRGRCLLCNPLPVRLSMQQQLQQQQHRFGGSNRSLENFSEDLESVYSGGGSSATQQHHQHQDAGWGQPSRQSSFHSANQSLDGERRHHHHRSRRGGRSDSSVGSAQSYNSAPVAYGARSHQSQHSNSNAHPMSVPSASTINRSAAPPIEEFTLYSTRGGGREHQRPPREHHQQQQQQHEQQNYENSHAAGNTSNFNDMVIDEDQGQQPDEVSSHARARSPQQQQQQQSQPTNEEASIHQILSSMQRYPNHIPTQSKGLHSLWVLSWDHVNACAIGRLGGIPLILDSMRLHTSSMSLQSNGISTLQNLAMDSHNRDILTESDGVTVIVELMAQFIEDKAMQQSGCTALANLANGSPEQKAHVAESGGILSMMRAVDAHRGDESILRAAYQALRKLGYTPGS